MVSCVSATSKGDVKDLFLPNEHLSESDQDVEMEVRSDADNHQ